MKTSDFLLTNFLWQNYSKNHFVAMAQIQEQVASSSSTPATTTTPQVEDSFQSLWDESKYSFTTY
jgi:hypothetical protein